jgi:hypothetical protein
MHRHVVVVMLLSGAFLPRAALASGHGSRVRRRDAHPRQRRVVIRSGVDGQNQ